MEFSKYFPFLEKSKRKLWIIILAVVSFLTVYAFQFLIPNTDPKEISVNDIKAIKVQYFSKYRVTIKDSSDIKKLWELQEKNSYLGHANNLINDNRGYLTVDAILIDSTMTEIFSIIYTKHNGIIIRKPFEYYYRNKELVDFIENKIQTGQ